MGNRVCEILGIEYPVIQAPMGWVTSAELAAAVSNAGADIIVATGFDEGGCMPSLAIGTMEAVSMIKAAVSVPVMAAGGMVNANTTKAAFALGAEGIYAGTRFIASVENPASDVCKQDIVNCKSSDTILIPAIKSYYRVTPHKKALELAEMNAKGATVEQISAQMGGVIKNGMLDGNLDIGLNIIGGAIGSITSIKPAAEIVKDFFDGVDF